MSVDTAFPTLEELLGDVKRPETPAELLELLKSWADGHVQDLQWERARVPRPKKHPTHRSEVVEEMRQYRFVDGDSPLETFLGADIDGITITPMNDRPNSDKKKKFKVICEAIRSPQDPEKEVSLGTLYEWWGEAAKKRR